MNILEIANAIHECRRRGMICLRMYGEGRVVGIAIVVEGTLRKCWTQAELAQALAELPDEPHDFTASMARMGHSGRQKRITAGSDNDESPPAEEMVSGAGGPGASPGHASKEATP